MKFQTDSLKKIALENNLIIACPEKLLPQISLIVNRNPDDKMLHIIEKECNTYTLLTDRHLIIGDMSCIDNKSITESSSKKLLNDIQLKYAFYQFCDLLNQDQLNLMQNNYGILPVKSLNSLQKEALLLLNTTFDKALLDNSTLQSRDDYEIGIGYSDSLLLQSNYFESTWQPVWNFFTKQQSSKLPNGFFSTQPSSRIFEKENTYSLTSTISVDNLIKTIGLPKIVVDGRYKNNLFITGNSITSYDTYFILQICCRLFPRKIRDTIFFSQLPADSNIVNGSRSMVFRSLDEKTQMKSSDIKSSFMKKIQIISKGKPLSPIPDELFIQSTRFSGSLFNNEIKKWLIDFSILNPITSRPINVADIDKCDILFRRSFWFYLGINSIKVHFPVDIS